MTRPQFSRCCTVAFFAMTISGALLLPAILSANRPQQSPPANASLHSTAEGQQIFERHCAVCHGFDGGGGRGPRLTRPHLPHAPDDATLRSVIADGLPPAMPDAWFLNDEEVADVAAYVRSIGAVPPEKLAGDATRGAAVYAKSACSHCHIFNDEGLGYGPELTGIGERRGASLIRQVLRKPSSALPENFLLVKVMTSSGQTIQGIRLNEDTFSIQLRDAEGHSHSFRKQELKEFQKLRGETPMPSFEGALSAAELDDLVAYLVTSREKP
jgi:cytochrome c oxidase cbb3-type subunit 3